MFSVTFQGFSGLRVTYLLAGEVRSIYLPRLERVIRASLAHGMTVCFDMQQVTSLDAGVVTFFTDGPGREAQVLAPPGKLQAVIEGRDERNGV